MIIVCDLEATCWTAEVDPELRKNQDDECEIIEIGAVRVHPETWHQLDSYEGFVQATLHPLSPFCTELTSITQAMSDAGDAYPDAWAKFVEWIGVPLEEVTFISWSSFDQNQFRREARRHGLPEPAWTWVDAKRHYCDWRKWSLKDKGRWGLNRAVRMAGLDWVGRHHRGIDDAINIARLLHHIRDPRRSSPEAQLVLKLMGQRDPEPTHRGHMTPVEPLARRWFDRARKELVRAGAVVELAGGAGLVLTDRGRASLD